MKSRFLLALAGFAGLATTAFGATNVSYTATADPNVNPDGTTSTGVATDVWTLSYNGTGTSPTNYGSFLGNSANNGGGSAAGAGTSAWGLYASGGTTGNNEVDMGHTYTGGMLALGQSTSVQFDAGYVDNGNQYGIRFFNSTGFALSLSFVGGDAGYRYYDANASGTLAGFGYNPDGFTFTYKQLTATTYSATVVQGATTLGTWNGSVTSAPTFIQIYNSNAGSGSNYDVYANNLTVVPEPGATIWVGAGGLAAATLGLRRRRLSASSVA